MTIYHYTTGQGLFGILESDTLHCSNVNFLNDTSETHYFFDLIEFILSRNNKLKEIHNTLFDELIFDVFASPKDKFIGSFCNNNDSLSMWGLYSNSNGYCLGIDDSKVIENNRLLFENENTIYVSFSNLEYNKDKTLNNLEQILKSSVIDFDKFLNLKDKLEANTITEFSENDSEFTMLEDQLESIKSSYVQKLINQFVITKHNAYSNEDEVRIIVEEIGNKGKKSKYKVSSSGIIIEYFPLKLNLKDSFKSITLHPACNDLHAEGLNRYLKSKYQIDNPNILRSEIPFRQF